MYIYVYRIYMHIHIDVYDRYKTVEEKSRNIF